jgi:hypothetical protein
MKLIRIKDLPKDFPVKIGTLYKWHHFGRYPDLLVKFGGGLCIDEDQISSMTKRRSIPIRKANKTDD